MFGIKHRIENKEFFLVYNGTAMFELQGIEVGELLKNYEMVLHAYYVLAREGELVKRYYGFEKSDILSEVDFKTIVSPSEFASMAAAVLDAYSAGLKSELDTHNQKIDVTTLELEKLEKKTE